MMPKIINDTADWIYKKFGKYIESRWGNIFLFLTLLGALTFIPTLYKACTAPNIDPLKTLTWPLMVIINASGLTNAIKKGTWQTRLSSFSWFVMMITMTVVVFIIR